MKMAAWIYFLSFDDFPCWLRVFIRLQWLLRWDTKAIYRLCYYHQHQLLSYVLLEIFTISIGLAIGFICVFINGACLPSVCDSWNLFVEYSVKAVIFQRKRKRRAFDTDFLKNCKAI